MVQDRGSIKWVSLMLPEHVKMLREWQDEQKNPRSILPVLDEQKKEELNNTVYEALYKNSPVRFTYIEHGTYKTLQGRIQTFNEVAHELKIMDAVNKKHVIKLSYIIDVTFD